MSTHFAKHVRESVIGPDSVQLAVSAQEMNTLKQLGVAVIQRAIDDAQGIGVKTSSTDQVDAQLFLCNDEDRMSAWASLAGLRLDAVVEYALRRGYDRPPSNIVRGAVSAPSIPIEEQQPLLTT